MCQSQSPINRAKVYSLRCGRSRLSKSTSPSLRPMFQNPFPSQGNVEQSAGSITPKRACKKNTPCRVGQQRIRQLHAPLVVTAREAFVLNKPFQSLAPSLGNGGARVIRTKSLLQHAKEIYHFLMGQPWLHLHTPCLEIEGYVSHKTMSLDPSNLFEQSENITLMKYEKSFVVDIHWNKNFHAKKF